MLKLEISYRVIIYLEGFWFLVEDFLKIIFLHGEIFEVFIILLLCLKIPLNVNYVACAVDPSVNPLQNRETQHVNIVLQCMYRCFEQPNMKGKIFPTTPKAHSNSSEILSYDLI